MVEISGVRYLTVDEVCALLQVKRETIYAYVSRGVLRSYKQGIKRQRLYREDEVIALLSIQPDIDSIQLSNNEAQPGVADPHAERLPRAEGWMGEV